MKKLSLSVLFSLAITVSGIGQITIAPTNLFVSDNSRFGTYMVINNSNENQEVSIDFVFSYTITDSNGERVFIEDDSVKAQEHSISEYVRAFPQNFVLNPGQRQIVRLRIAVPNTSPDGTYWTRIKTASNPQSPPAELGNNDAVSARLGMVVEQVTGLFYKKGNVNTGIDINNITLDDSESDKLNVLVDYSRTGNSPFLGTITTNLVNASGETVDTKYLSTTIYFDGVHSQSFDTKDLPAGNYTVNVAFETVRRDIEPSDLIQMDRKTQSTSYTKR